MGLNGPIRKLGWEARCAGLPPQFPNWSNGTCDFLLSRSTELIDTEAPVFILVEAKKADLRSGLGQCAAEMVAAQRFNQMKGRSISTIYGCVSNGTQWRFLQLREQVLTVDLSDYPLPPVEQILAFLVWIAEN